MPKTWQGLKRFDAERPEHKRFDVLPPRERERSYSTFIVRGPSGRDFDTGPLPSIAEIVQRFGCSVDEAHMAYNGIIAATANGSFHLSVGERERIIGEAIRFQRELEWNR